MKPWIKKILILYIIIVVLKISLAGFILAPSAFSDDYGYAKVARSLFHYGTFTVHEEISTGPPLYSVILSISYIFKDMEWVYFFMKVINSLVSSLVIFPAWFLSREFFNEKKSMLMALMIVLFPPFFGFAFLLMSENLFYPLFLFSIYFIYKSFIEESYKWDILAGLFVGLAYMSKINAIILPVAIFFLFLFKLFKKDYKEIRKKIIMILAFTITMLPWTVRNFFIFGFSKSVLLGRYGRSFEGTLNTVAGNTQPFLLGFLIWVMLYLGYLMIATGFIFFIANFFTFKNSDKKEFIFSLLTLSSILLLVLLAARSFKITDYANYKTLFSNLIGGGRIIGRYVEAVIPLILINGLLGFKYLKKNLKIFTFFLILLIFSSQLIFFQLFPINNMSLAWLGTLKFVFDFVIYHELTFESVFSYWYLAIFAPLFIMVFLLLTYLQKRISVKKLLYFFIIFFSLVSLLNFAIIYYNSYTYWYNSEQTQLGLWFNQYDPKVSIVLFDERDGCKIFKTNQTCIYNPFTGGGSATIIGFWMNDKIKVGLVDNLKGIDYVVSRHELDLPLLKKTKNGIFLYKVNKESKS